MNENYKALTHYGAVSLSQFTSVLETLKNSQYSIVDENFNNALHPILNKPEWTGIYTSGKNNEFNLQLLLYYNNKSFKSKKNLFSFSLHDDRDEPILTDEVLKLTAIINSHLFEK